MPVFETSRKVQVFGSSLATTLPALFVKANEVEKGEKLSVFYNLDGVLVISTFEDADVLSERLKNIIELLEKKDVKNMVQKIEELSKQIYLFSHCYTLMAFDYMNNFSFSLCSFWVFSIWYCIIFPYIKLILLHLQECI